MVWLLEHTAKFPRSERYRLAKTIGDALFALHESLLYAAMDKSQTGHHLAQANIHLTRLRTYLRIALELRHTSQSQYAYAATQLVEISNLLGGWIKSTHTKAKA